MSGIRLAKCLVLDTVTHCLEERGPIAMIITVTIVAICYIFKAELVLINGKKETDIGQRSFNKI